MSFCLVLLLALNVNADYADDYGNEVQNLACDSADRATEAVIDKPHWRADKSE